MGKSYLRTDATQQRYDEKRRGVECFLCRGDCIQSYFFWQVYPNDYPYDKVAKRHALLTPKRHIKSFYWLYPWEWVELVLILWGNEQRWGSILWNYPSHQSQPQHVHIHLLEWHD